MKPIIQAKLSPGSGFLWKPREVSSIANPCMAERMARTA